MKQLMQLATYDMQYSLSERFSSLGSIPAGAGELTGLVKLDLHDNALSGKMWRMMSLSLCG